MKKESTWIRLCELDAVRHELPPIPTRIMEHDKFAQLRREYLKHPHPSNTQYGWVWQENGREPTAPVGSS